MTIPEILQSLAEDYPDCLTADGFDEAILGIVEGAGRETVVAYDYDQCVEILMRDDAMDRETAEEHMDFNVVGAFVGPCTPLFVHDWRK
jgi:hypothetical protein